MSRRSKEDRRRLLPSRQGRMGRPPLSETRQFTAAEVRIERWSWRKICST